MGCSLCSFNLEFFALSDLTGKEVFKLKAEHVRNFIINDFSIEGLLQGMVNVRRGQRPKNKGNVNMVV